mgnify:CR=1 FL=1
MNGSDSTRMSHVPANGSEENWGALRALSIYRWAIAALIFGLWFTAKADSLYPNLLTQWLPALCGLYLIVASLISMSLLFRWPGIRIQVYGQAGADITLTTALVMVTGGMESGLGVLMLTPVAGLGILLPRRMSALLAALASLALLGEEIARALYSLAPGADYTVAGIIGVLLFIVTIAANTLAQRARLNALLAEKRGIDLANLSQLNERVIQHMAVGVLVLDEQGRIRMHNHAAARLLNATRESITGLPLARVSPELVGQLNAWRQSPQPTFDGKLMEINGQTLLPHFNRLGPGATQGPALIFLEDAQRFGEQTQQIKLAALGRLTASIAHEIRNPLGAISHASQLIQQWENTPEEEQRLLSIIERHCQRINQIVINVLNLSKREQTVPEVIDLRHWLEQVSEEYMHSHQGCKLAFQLSDVPENLQVRFDPGHLRQIIDNLWENAVQHAGQDSPVSIVSLQAGIDTESSRPYLDICDNGPGISREIAEQIFEPFYTSLYGGTGLGLYIARELCECNHAQLRLVPGRKQGACFRILFTSNLEWAA